MCFWSSLISFWMSLIMLLWIAVRTRFSALMKLVLTSTPLMYFSSSAIRRRSFSIFWKWCSVSRCFSIFLHLLEVVLRVSLSASCRRSSSDEWSLI